MRLNAIKNNELLIQEDTIKDVSLISIGEAKGHYHTLSESESYPIHVNKQMLLDVYECGKGKQLKVHLGHIGMCGDSFTQQIGLISNLRLTEDSVIGDIKFIRNEKDNADIDKILTWAKEAPNQFGLSIDFEASKFEVIDGIAYCDCINLNSADIVGYPAANERGLFSGVSDVMLRYLRQLANKEFEDITKDENFNKLLNNADKNIPGLKESVKTLFNNYPKSQRTFTNLEKLMKSNQTFAEHEIVGGGIMTVEAVAIGESVLINGEPAKAGEYVLMTGETVVVDELSTLKEVIPAKESIEIEKEVEMMIGETKEEKLAALKARNNILKLQKETQETLLEAAKLKLQKEKEGINFKPMNAKVKGNLAKFDAMNEKQRNLLSAIAYFKLGKPVSMDRAENMAKSKVEFSSAFNILKELTSGVGQGTQFAAPDVTGMIARNPFVITDQIRTVMYEMYSWYNTFGNQYKIASTNNMDTFNVAKSFATVDPVYGSDYLVEGGTDCSFTNQAETKVYNRLMEVNKQVLNYEVCPAQFADVFQGQVYVNDTVIPMEDIVVGYLIERMFNRLEQLHWETLIQILLSNSNAVTDVADNQLQKYITGTYNGTTQGALVNHITNYFLNMPVYLQQAAQEGKYKPITFMPFATLNKLRNDFRKEFKYNMELPEIIAGYDALVPAEMANVPMGMKQNTILTETGTSTALYPQLATLDPMNVMWAEHFGATPFYTWISNDGAIRMKATVWTGSDYVIPNEVYVSRQS